MLTDYAVKSYKIMFIIGEARSQGLVVIDEDFRPRHFGFESGY